MENIELGIGKTFADDEAAGIGGECHGMAEMLDMLPPQVKAGLSAGILAGLREKDDYGLLRDTVIHCNRQTIRTCPKCILR